ncbi:MAG: hypothetical protein AB7N76_14590 [Planctomycetota bacterium]
MGAELDCANCGKTTPTSAAPGRAVACRGCGTQLRVPLRQVTQLEVSCEACGEVQRTGAAPGRKTTCKACGERFRVPMRATDAGRELTCEACGEVFRTGATPGKKGRCPACGEETRVPLRDPDEAEPKPRSTCPKCAATYRLSDLNCPECGAGGIRPSPLDSRAIDLAVVVAALLFAATVVALDGLPLRHAIKVTALIIAMAEGILTWARSR